MEPTDTALQAGCLGNVNGTWTFTGRSGHSARPWLADNAIEHAARGIAALALIAPVEHDFGGLTYTEVISVTTIAAGIADNVIPDEARAHVNYRYPPGMTPDAAAARAHELCDPFGSLEITSNAPSGPVPLGNPLVDAPVRRGRPATRAQAGVDAGRRVRRRRRRRGELRPGRAAVRAHPRRARGRRRPRPRVRGDRRLRAGRLMQLSPLLDELGTYPFARLTHARERAVARGVRLIDFGVGEPREETPAFIREALVRAIEDEPVSRLSRSPSGLPELREAIAAWLRRRFGVRLDPGIEILPTLGSKEAIHGLAQVLIGAGQPARPRRRHDARATPSPAAARGPPGPASSRCRSTRSPAGCPRSTPSAPRSGGASR